MKPIRITADLHGDRHALETLAMDAGDYSLTIVAGDLMDLFGSAGARRQQIAAIQRWMQRMVATGSWLVWCDGNHDCGLQTPASPRIIGPGSNQIIEQVAVVSSMPWDRKQWSLDGLKLAQTQQGTLPWLVVAHQPPPSSNLGCGNFDIADHTEYFLHLAQPNYYICGHIHEAPYRQGTCHEQLRGTCIINVGRRQNHINSALLNPSTGQILWYG